MPSLRPFFREAGSGPGVVCLHANASTSGQWRALMDALADKFHVLAADLSGSGQSPACPADRQCSLRDEVDFLEPVLARAGDRYVLVGHSYGAAVALIAAVSQPHRVRALACTNPYSSRWSTANRRRRTTPTGFAMPWPAQPLRSTRPIRRAPPSASSTSGWAKAHGTGCPPRQAPIAASIGNIRRWAAALFSEPTPLSAFSALHLPTLFMTGSDSPAPSRAVARLLTGVLPQVQAVELRGVGHMGPITHTEIVNDVIVRFLEGC